MKSAGRTPKIRIQFGDEMLLIKEIVQRTGVCESTIRRRLQNGWAWPRLAEYAKKRKVKNTP